MTIGDAANDLAQVFGFPDFLSAPAEAQERILLDINSAIQQLRNSGEDYYNREDLTVKLEAGVEKYVLDDDIQNVLGPVRLSDETILRQLTSRGQLYQYGQLFVGQLTPDVADGKPTAFFISSVRDTVDPDEVAIIIHLVPNPSPAEASSLTLTVPVIREPAVFDLSDLTAGTSALPVPQKYGESIFMPLARWNATTSFMFFEKEKLPRYEQDYSRALRLLKKADPRSDYGDPLTMPVPVGPAPQQGASE